MGITNQALPSGYQLLNYRIDRQISRGGFSIVYRAFDDGGGPVAIKEYLPSSLVLRTEGDIVRASTAENLKHAALMQKFPVPLTSGYTTVNVTDPSARKEQIEMLQRYAKLIKSRGIKAE